MIVAVETLTSMTEFSGKSEAVLKKKLKAVELLIRAYTNNNFQNRFVRFEGKSNAMKVYGTSPFLKVGDTVQITKSGVNDGLYQVTELADTYTGLDADLYEVPYNLITKVEYPDDIVQGVIDLMVWEVKNRQKVGIKSETLSRHSVSYYDQDANNQVMGYPVALLGFLQPYIKPRF